MIFLILQKPYRVEGEKEFYWYDSFFKKMITIKGTGYTIKTKYGPYCVIKDQKTKVEEAIDIFKKYNKIDHLPNEVVLEMMKERDLVFYDYIQEPISHRAESKKSALNNSDFYKITKLLDDLDLDYNILLKNPQGIRIEIEEVKDAEDKEAHEKALSEFLEEIEQYYDCKVN